MINKKECPKYVICTSNNGTGKTIFNVGEVYETTKYKEDNLYLKGFQYLPIYFGLTALKPSKTNLQEYTGFDAYEYASLKINSSSYKLIKEYPNSPSLGSIISKDEIYNPHLVYAKLNEYREFWEEIVEKDYEILTFKVKCNGAILTRRSNNKFCATRTTSAKGIYTEEDILSNKPERVNWGNSSSGQIYGYVIDSVKRFSDGEIFNVGEKVNFQGNGCSGKHIIREFIIKNNYIAVNGLVVEFPLKNIEKLAKLLFTTEDGVDIVEGDKTCWLNNWHVTNLVYWERYDGSAHKHFSTKEAAEKYVLLNKPCLSLTDVAEYYPSAAKGNSKNSKCLISLIKSRL